MAIDPQVGAIAIAVGATIFAGSAAMKFAAPAEFQAAVENYRIVPQAVALLTAWSVPLLEMAGAVGLLWAPARAVAGALLLSLLTIFTGAIAINLARGRRQIDCGCFGPVLRQHLSGWLIVRNAALAVVLAVAIGDESIRPFGAVDYVTIVSAAASLVMLYAAANYLLANAPVTEAMRMGDV
jgi:hypothetical protein